ncbi:MAG: Hpt domain-containing protein [Spirochaetaceae bacterium]|jgi:HPt (histidine-containing phosphotransfer) domain-containing protein|nr:Hpt domain-containing protein [Spirochaetaceae bacterium]
MVENDKDPGIVNGLVYVDREDGLKRVVNNTGLYVRLLDKFRTGTNPDELFGSLAAGDYEKARVAIHTIKGVAANLSLQELYKQALDLESQIKALSVNPGAPEAFRACFDETLRCIDRVITQYG